MWNKFRYKLTFARNYYGEVFFSSLLLLVILSFALRLTTSQIVYVFLLVALFDIILLRYIGRKRFAEISKIKSTINAIRSNKFQTPEEIKLDKSLIELESEIKAMFLRVQNDIANLKKLEQVRTEFLGNVSHELRTPIFAIQGYLETLLNGALNDKKVNMNFLSKANQHTINLNNLLNDLIDISMIESGQMRMSFRYFNIKEYLEGVTHDMRPYAEAKNIQIILHPIRPGLQLFGDKDRLKQVMNNLLSNAIKYTDRGRIEILVEEIEDVKEARVIVRDTGIGLTSTDIDRVFERFYRVDKVRSRSEGGTGLGLAIVKHIIEAHQSRIEVRSEVGKGSEFSFKLKR